MNQLVVLFAVAAVAVAAPSGIPLAAPLAPLWPHAGVAHVVEPAVVSAPALALSKTVHYAPTPVVTGYTSSVVKPDLGVLATPLHTVTKQAVLAPARPVDTIVPQVTHVQPELSVRTVPVDVPVHTPVVSEVEVRANPAPVVIPAPVAVPAPVAAPILRTPVALNPHLAVAHGLAIPSAHGLVVPGAHGIIPAAHTLL